MNNRGLDGIGGRAVLRSTSPPVVDVRASTILVPPNFWIVCAIFFTQILLQLVTGVAEKHLFS